MKRKTIYFGDIVVKDGKNEKTVKNAVFSEGDITYKGMKILKIISQKDVGKTSITKTFTEVNGSDEKRNNITGAYE